MQKFLWMGKRKKTGVARRDLGTFLKSLFHFYCGASSGTRKKWWSSKKKKKKTLSAATFQSGGCLLTHSLFSHRGKAEKSCTCGRLKETRRFSRQAHRRQRCFLTKGGRKTCNYWKGCHSSTCCFASLLKWIWDSCYLGNCSLRSTEAQMTHRSHFQGILAADIWFNMVSRQTALYLKSLISNKWLIGPPLALGFSLTLSLSSKPA